MRQSTRWAQKSIANSITVVVDAREFRLGSLILNELNGRAHVCGPALDIWMFAATLITLRLSL